MKKIIYLSLISCCLTVNLFSQIHHNIQDNAVFNTAERIAKFSVADAPKDLLEIVNGTRYSNQFVPNIWAHRESDNRYVFNIFSSINSSVDSGTQPLMTFRAEVRNSIYDSYPFPWGSQVAQIQNRPLFSWANYNSTKMLMKANGNLGLGTTNPSYKLQVEGDVYANGWLRTSGSKGLYFQSYGGGFYMQDSQWIRTYNNKSFYHNTGIMRTDGVFQVGSSGNRFTVTSSGNVGVATTAPTAKLHSNGTVRFQNLPNATTPTYILGTDASGNVKEYPANTGGGSSDSDWFKVGGGTPNSILDNIYTHGKVGVNTSSPTAYLHSKGSVRLENLPLGKGNPNYLLGVDTYGNVNRYPQIIIFLKTMKETIEKQQNQITLLQNKIASFKTDSYTNLLVSNKLTSFSTNFPNPFSLTTTIDYTILKGIKEAKIIIYNTNGSTIKTYNLKERDHKGQLTIRKEGMKSGVYFYTLITDGIVIGTKKMIVK